MDVETSISIISSFTINGYISVAGYVILIYDHFLTLDLEADLIWPAPWSVSKFLYIILAYLGFSICVIIPGCYIAYRSPSTCTAIFKSHIIMMACLMALGEFVLVFRAWAILGKRKMVGIGLFVASAAAIIVALVCLVLGLDHIKFISNPPPNGSPCLLVEGESKITSVALIIVACVDSVILFMTLYHLRRKNVRASSSILIATVYKDEILYYICMFAFSMINVIIIVATVSLQTRVSS
ncbi:hypothetical protein JB92DRAFT_2894421 [Gautieria morchelliformis]|nr:hypothetical protein JB92DRAFT_2894421 [Gautieria morchelliformis]